MEIVSALRNKEIGSVSGIKSTELCFKDGTTKTCKVIRGSVVWLYGDFPGIILVAYQLIDSDKIEIAEERVFTNINEAISILDELWAYRPSVYYHKDDSESEAFISFLKRTSELQGKIPFAPAYYPDSESYGFRLIQDFLGKNRLMLPPESGALALQLQNARHDTPMEEVFAITALRYLLAGIKEMPWEKEIEEFDLESCLL